MQIPAHLKPRHAKRQQHNHQQQTQTVGGRHQVGPRTRSLREQGHFSSAANGARKITRRPCFLFAMGSFPLGQQAGMLPVQPSPKKKAQGQGPNNAHPNGPPQAHHQGTHLRCEVQTQRGANDPLPCVAQTVCAASGQAGQRARRCHQQGAEHPGNGRVHPLAQQCRAQGKKQSDCDVQQLAQGQARPLKRDDGCCRPESRRCFQSGTCRR